MRQMNFESVGTIRPDCPARPAAARFRRAFVRHYSNFDKCQPTRHNRTPLKDFSLFHPMNVLYFILLSVFNFYHSYI